MRTGAVLANRPLAMAGATNGRRYWPGPEAVAVTLPLRLILIGLSLSLRRLIYRRYVQLGGLPALAGGVDRRQRGAVFLAVAVAVE